MMEKKSAKGKKTRSLRKVAVCEGEKMFYWSKTH